VFYYCNEHGSSVFFDQLGPPWPKHPCTDHAAVHPVRLSAALTISSSRAQRELGDGWHLSTISHVASIDKYVREILVREVPTATDQVLYATTRQATGNIDISSTFTRHALVFLRQIRSGVFILSTLERGLRPVQVEAFSSRIALHEQIHSVGKLSQKKGYRKRSRNKSISSETSSSSQVETALSVAFDNASKCGKPFK
jgi:hypothetical protein